ncbi:M24 family metallopeptidase [Halovenus marina]|uniref:M24 family metallopeptidase n=1 Tax=Halovenus marina TaxID=3396621 RepID=UPI003F5680D7
MTRLDEIPDGRLERLDDLLAAESLSTVWFARPNGFAWLTGGNNVVDRAGDIGVAAAGYDGDRVRVLTNDIEAQRLRDEELPEGVPVETFEWHASSLAAELRDRSPKPAAADFDVPGFAAIDSSALRQPLTDADVERYRELGGEVAAALEATCRSATPGDTEREVGARLRARLAEAGIDSPVTLVGSERRAPLYRHPTLTDESLGGYAVVIVTAERDGLFASCTRTVAFDPPEWLSDRHAAATRVEASALAATRDIGQRGGTAGDVFAHVQETFDAVGWPEEWREHHQGGAAGYAGREWIATPESTEPVHLPMAYAWSPTVQGAKSEDTYLVTADGYEVLTAGDWPTRTVSAVGYDETFERPDILG